jgi:integrase/recombinase XerD
VDGVFDQVERDIGSIRLPRWGRVVPTEGVVPWLVVGPNGVPVEPIRRFLVDFVAQDNRLGSVRSYAYDLLRWWRPVDCTKSCW